MKDEPTILLASVMFPGSGKTLEELERQYPERSIAAGAMVTRFAPSPTGFMHIGGILAALISERLAHQSGGVFFLRIEDTDKKREIVGAIEVIVNSFAEYGITVDEGEMNDGLERGAYGPYRQSARLDIYRACAKHLVEIGRAYPCFCTADQLERDNTEQAEQKMRPGYYGTYAHCRTLTPQEAADKVRSGTPFVVRLRSSGDFHHKVRVDDAVKGAMELSRNDIDAVLLKSDRYPTYHFAHIVDDHFMRTTHVLRGDEWLSSTPLHIELWESFGWNVPLYGHIAPIQKMDGDSKRKLSKRKDPEANVAYYRERGYPPRSVVEYLLNIANSGFEDWRRNNPAVSYSEFPLSLKKLPPSGALFDEVKLANISKRIIGEMSVHEKYREILMWASDHDTSFARLMHEREPYYKEVLSIDQDDATRKDLSRWSDAPKEAAYFFAEYFDAVSTIADDICREMSRDSARNVLEMFLGTYDPQDGSDEWFGKVKKLAASLGYAPSAKEFKEHPELYKGQVGTVAQVIRIATTGRSKTPDLCRVMKILGPDVVRARIRRTINLLDA